MNEPIPFDIDKFELWLRAQPGFGQTALHSLKPLSQDGSGRVFWRLWLSGMQPENYVYIEHPLTGGPVFAGDEMPQAKAFVEAARVLAEHKLPVPRIAAVESAEGKILMEDVGEVCLAALLKDPPGEFRENLEELLSSSWLEKLFEQGIDLVLKLQSIEFDKRFVGFRRYRSIDFLRAEINEFTDFYGAQNNLRLAARTELKKIFDPICEELFSLPKTLSLFDYNCFNLFLDTDRLEAEAENVLRILDFQDVSLSSPCRDLFSLLNDRGIDEALGHSRQQRLIRYFVEKKGLNGAKKDDFLRHYYLTALHWDFRVVGRFVKLNSTLGTDRYSQWIPPTLRRLGRNLALNEHMLPGLGDAAEIVLNLSPEAKEGSQEDWRISL